MERKGSNTAVVTKELVTEGLSTAKTSQREEQALRMRYGATVNLKAPLPQAHGGDEGLADELLLIEMQLLRGLKARASKTAAASTKSAVKAKITSKLKK